MLLLATGPLPAQELVTLPCGFHVEVFADSLYRPTDLAADSSGNLYVATGEGDTGSLPILKFAPDGSHIASSPIKDPDGIHVTASGEVYVGGMYEVSKVEFPSGTYSRYANGFNNLSSIAMDSSGTMFVGENKGWLKEVTPPYGGTIRDTFSANCGAVFGDEREDAVYYGHWRSEVFKYAKGVVTQYSDGAPGFWDLTRAPGGVFGTDLYLATGDIHTIGRIDSEGGSSVWATLDYAPGASLLGIAFGDESTLYVAQPEFGRILVITPTKLELRGEPTLGSTVTVELKGRAGDGFCLGLGTEPGFVTKHGFGDILIDPTSIFTEIIDELPPGGTWCKDFQLPSDTRFVGRTYYAQVVIVCDRDAWTGTVSNRVDLTIMD